MQVSSPWHLRGVLLEHSIDIEHKFAKKHDDELALTMKKSHLEGTQKEFVVALAYFDKLKPSCVDVGVSEMQLVREPSWRAYHMCGPLLVATNSNSARWAMFIRLSAFGLPWHGLLRVSSSIVCLANFACFCRAAFCSLDLVLLFG